jgi:hypothetical protein
VNKFAPGYQFVGAIPFPDFLSFFQITVYRILNFGSHFSFTIHKPDILDRVSNGKKKKAANHLITRPFEIRTT